MKVIGIDPGLRSMGWGVISVQGSRISHIANGQCSGAGADMAERLLALHSALSKVIAVHRPDAAAVEQVFVNTNGAATLKLGQARGIALLVPAQAGLSVGEYAPNTIKKSVVGVGHAAKEQVQHMVRLQLPGVEFTGPDALMPWLSQFATRTTLDRRRPFRGSQRCVHDWPHRRAH